VSGTDSVAFKAVFAVSLCLATGGEAAGGLPPRLAVWVIDRIGLTMKKTLAALLGSRPGVILLTLALLLLLDGGRSIYARLGYAEPVATWQPDPKLYADMAWPPGSDLPANAPPAARIYAQRCAVCHGPDGRGNGPAAPSLIPRPRDFTLGQFKYKSTAAGLPPSDDDLIRTVTEGLNASAMPYARDLLSAAEIRLVVGYIKSFSSTFGGAVPATLQVPLRVIPTADSLARGQDLFRANGCQDCHGADGRGGLALKDAKGYPVIARDLTAPWTFRGGSEPEQLWLRLTTGLLPGPMPSIADKTTDAERWDIVNYVLSLSRTPPWEAGGKLDGPGQQPELTRRGAYLVHAEMCGLCHTPIDRSGIYRGDDFYLAGGMRVEAYPHAVIVSSNLTSDPETGLGDWSEDQIVSALRDGRALGRVLVVYDMPWIYFHSMSDDDALAIARYLKSQPPVHNQIPEPLRYGVLETIASKLTRPLPTVPTTVLTFADQQFGQQSGPARSWPQTWLINMQWAVLLVGAVALIFVAPRERRFPRSLLGWLGVVGLGLFGLSVYVLYELPLLTLIPAAQIAKDAVASIPRTNAAMAPSQEEAALVERGRYLFTVASCALCHGNDGSGGLKVSWKPMGTLWTRNLTSDADTGLGGWSGAEIARAIRSGISRDGYQLHWQGMTWDHASNWDEEDIRAIISYLRALPPVTKKIPPDRAPASDDCDVYTFWTSESRSAGCR
jgi:mono/diheme cytochrome c family protein